MMLCSLCCTLFVDGNKGQQRFGPKQIRQADQQVTVGHGGLVEGLVRDGT